MKMQGDMSSISIPHASGGEPVMYCPKINATTYSPREWGGSPAERPVKDQAASIPHVSGGEPYVDANSVPQVKYSPREWG